MINPEEKKRMYEEVAKALGGKGFVLIIPWLDKYNTHIGNSIISNIDRASVSWLLSKVAYDFKPNMKTIPLTNEKDNQD